MDRRPVAVEDVYSTISRRQASEALIDRSRNNGGHCDCDTSHTHQ